ncbi:hypothetical protein [Priestia megaterium]|uniref:hypothetical protein n=1 Tax=Priestia megaterium TaxID=1404 RepID=UPI00279597F7|nr:hypothetical protein [Priestia megaterium]
MDKQQKEAALEMLTRKELIDPVIYLIDDYQSQTGFSPAEYYHTRYEMAEMNGNDKQAKEAWELYNIFRGNDD